MESEGFCCDDEPGDQTQARLELQKKTLCASERDEEARGAWRERLRSVDPRRLVYRGRKLDERRPCPALGQGAQRREGVWEGAEELGEERDPHLLFISSITLAGMGPSMSIEGPSDGESFGLYLND